MASFEEELPKFIASFNDDMISLNKNGEFTGVMTKKQAAFITQMKGLFEGKFKDIDTLVKASLVWYTFRLLGGYDSFDELYMRSIRLKNTTISSTDANSFKATRDLLSIVNKDISTVGNADAWKVSLKDDWGAKDKRVNIVNERTRFLGHSNGVTKADLIGMDNLSILELSILNAMYDNEVSKNTKKEMFSIFRKCLIFHSVHTNLYGKYVPAVGKAKTAINPKLGDPTQAKFYCQEMARASSALIALVADKQELEETEYKEDGLIYKIVKAVDKPYTGSKVFAPYGVPDWFLSTRGLAFINATTHKATVKELMTDDIDSLPPFAILIRKFVAK